MWPTWRVVCRPGVRLEERGAGIDEDEDRRLRSRGRGDPRERVRQPRRGGIGPGASVGVREQAPVAGPHVQRARIRCLSDQIERAAVVDGAEVDDRRPRAQEVAELGDEGLGFHRRIISHTPIHRLSREWGIEIS